MGLRVQTVLVIHGDCVGAITGDPSGVGRCACFANLIGATCPEAANVVFEVCFVHQECALQCVLGMKIHTIEVDARAVALVDNDILPMWIFKSVW